MNKKVRIKNGLCIRRKMGIVKVVYKKDFYLISGLPRRSFLTARNDDVPFYSHVSRHCEARSNPENMEKL